VNESIRLFFLAALLVFIALSLGSCDLFEASLVDYLKETQETVDDDEDGEEEEENILWVYVSAASGNNANPGRTSGEPVKTIGKAREIWGGEDSTEAWIMLLEDIKPGNYTEAEESTPKGLIDFSALTIPSGITSITLDGGEGGKTIDNEKVTAPFRPVIYISNADKTITFKNLTITGGNGTDHGGGIQIDMGALVIGEGVSVRDNKTTNGGGGVYIKNGSLTMTGGEICENTAGSAGGGVYLNGSSYNGKFTMTGGKIHKNNANNGGGVFMGNNSVIFEMKGGEIYENTAAGSSGNGGGVNVSSDGSFTMTGGTIRDNKSDREGGGVYVGSGLNPHAFFEMEGGTISGNEALSTSGAKGGGVGVGRRGTFAMTGGTIKGNNSGNDGGGVYVYGANGTNNNGTALIRGGSIGETGAGNTAKYGAGLYVGAYGHLALGSTGEDHPYPYVQCNESSGTGGGIVVNGGSNSEAIFHHGTVGNNKAGTLGGGILVVDGTLDMRGGRVAGNTVNGTGKGPGITVESNGSLTMGGNARVLEADNPVYLYGAGLKINIKAFDYMADIAKIATNGYSSGTQILAGTPEHLTEYHGRFDVDGKGFEHSLNSAGVILP
jgi:hypothetical protein